MTSGPDLTTRQTGEALIVDVTAPFEGCDEAFEKARAEKLSKYHPLKTWLVSQDDMHSASVYTFLWWPLQEPGTMTTRTL